MYSVARGDESVEEALHGLESVEEALVAYFVLMTASRKRCMVSEVWSVEGALYAYFMVKKVSRKRCTVLKVTRKRGWVSYCLI